MFSKLFPENRAIGEIMCKNMVRVRQTTDDSVQRMRIECWITNATDTHSEYVIFIVCPQQQWLRERVSALHYTYSACLGFFIVKGRHTFEIECPDAV